MTKREKKIQMYHKMLQLKIDTHTHIIIYTLQHITGPTRYSRFIPISKIIENMSMHKKDER